MPKFPLRRASVVGSLVLLAWTLLCDVSPFRNETTEQTTVHLLSTAAPLPSIPASIVALSSASVESAATIINTAAGSPCGLSAPLVPSHVHFQQVQSYVGAVNLSDIAHQMKLLVSADPTIPNTDGRLRIVFFALDGTLLNLLRWGQIVNDNDIDLGFYIMQTSPLEKEEMYALNASRPLEHYHFLQEWLFHVGLMGRAIDDRDVRKLHNSRKVLKPQTCKHRGQMMQCRLDASKVIIDWFGGETIEVAHLTDIAPYRDIFPLQKCKAFSGSFPCPAQPIRVLKQFTLNVGTTASGPVPHREFTGCALFPRKASEQTRSHVESILEHGQWLQRCNYPNLLVELTPQSSWFEASCAAVMAKVELR